MKKGHHGEQWGQVEGEVGARVVTFLWKNVRLRGFEVRFLYRPPQRPLPAYLESLRLSSLLLSPFCPTFISCEVTFPGLTVASRVPLASVACGKVS